MRIDRAFDSVPLWLVVLATILLFLGATEVGFRLGHIRRQMPRREGASPSGTMVAATLGLLGFMLAFTFNAAGSRFEARQRLVLSEANAIRTAFLRARLLPEPQSTEIKELLRRYANVRLLGAEQPEEVRRLRTVDATRQARIESEEIHTALWLKSEGLARADPRSMATGLFAQSLNELIDIHNERLTVVIRYRVPAIIWITLLLLSLLAMVALGFHAGLASPRRSAGSLVVTLAFVLVLALIVDLDRWQEGFLQTGWGPLFDARTGMEAMR